MINVEELEHSFGICKAHQDQDFIIYLGVEAQIAQAQQLQRIADELVEANRLTRDGLKAECARAEEVEEATNEQ